MKDQQNSESAFMQYKVYMEDLTNIVDVCTKKCINNYVNDELNTTERLCLEKCYVKAFSMNQYLMDEYSNIMSKHNI